MDIKQAKTLIEKYHNCKTSVEEEMQLKDFFSRENIPEEFAGQKKYFQYLVQEKEGELPNQYFERELFNRINAKQTLFQIYKTPISIAASIILLLAMYILIPKEYLKKKTYFSQIEDTYEDPYQAYLEAKRTFAFVAEKLETGTKELANISTIDRGMQELNKLKKVDNAISQYGKMASINKLDQFFPSF